MEGEVAAAPARHRWSCGLKVDRVTFSNTCHKSDTNYYPNPSRTFGPESKLYVHLCGAEGGGCNVWEAIQDDQLYQRMDCEAAGHAHVALSRV